MNNRNSFSRAGGAALCALLTLTYAVRAQQSPEVATKPVIERAEVSTDNQLVIQGLHLIPASGPPKVQVDGATLTVTQYQTGQIVATFPSSLVSLGGSVLLKVIANGTGTFDLAVGTTGPQGPRARLARKARQVPREPRAPRVHRVPQVRKVPPELSPCHSRAASPRRMRLPCY
jgi:hypothetical protein